MPQLPGHRTAIPPALHGTLFDLSQNLNAATGRKWSDGELTAWLLEHHGIEVSRETVSRCLRPLRTEARQALIERVRSSVAEKIPEQFAKLDELMEKAAIDGLDSKTTKARARAIDTFRKALETKVRSIAGDDAKVTISGAANTLADFLSAAFGDAEEEGEGPTGPMEG
jgi:arginine repressor